MLGHLEEVAHAVLFLPSSESSFVAGHELFADGGGAAVWVRKRVVDASAQRMSEDTLRGTDGDLVRQEAVP